MEIPTQVSRPSKSRNIGGIYIFPPHDHGPSLPYRVMKTQSGNQYFTVGQNKIAKWTNFSCQKQAACAIPGMATIRRF